MNLAPNELLTILYQDEHLVAVHKPLGMLVHRGMGANREETFLLQAVRDQIGARVYPPHRLDRATSGIVLFALQPGTVTQLQKAWEEGLVRKTYLAIVRGWPATPQGVHDEELPDPNNGHLKSARTRWQVLDQVEVPRAVGPYNCARYALLQLDPDEGRWHQLRRHLRRMGHPIVGDTTHGDRNHNHFFQEALGVWRLHLYATQLSFPHPISGEEILLKDDPQVGPMELWQHLKEIPPMDSSFLVTEVT